MLIASTSRDVVTRYMNALHGGAPQNRAVTETVEAQATAKWSTASNTLYQTPVLGSNSSLPPTPLSAMFPIANETRPPRDYTDRNLELSTKPHHPKLRR